MIDSHRDEPKALFGIFYLEHRKNQGNIMEKVSVSFHLSVFNTMADVILQIMSKVWYCFARILRLPGHGTLKLTLLITKKAKEA